MLTGQSIRACLRREVPADHEAHSHTQRRQLRERVSYALSNSASAGLQPGGRSGNTTNQSRRVPDRGKPSRAKPDERCRTPLAVQTFEADSNDKAFSATRKSGPHVPRRNPRPSRRQGGQPSSEQSRSNQALGSLTSTHSVWGGGGGGVFFRVGLETPRPRAARERACGGAARGGRVNSLSDTGPDRREQRGVHSSTNKNLGEANCRQGLTGRGPGRGPGSR